MIKRKYEMKGMGRNDGAGILILRILLDIYKGLRQWHANRILCQKIKATLMQSVKVFGMKGIV